MKILGRVERDAETGEHYLVWNDLAALPTYERDVFMLGMCCSASEEGPLEER